MKAGRLLASAIIALATYFTAAAQPQLITSDLTDYDPYAITFTDVAQRIITVTLTESVTVTSGTTGWTFTVGGVGVAASGPVVTGNVLNFQLPAGAITFANCTNVRISYNGTGNITGSVSGLQLGA